MDAPRNTKRTKRVKLPTKDIKGRLFVQSNEFNGTIVELYMEIYGKKVFGGYLIEVKIPIPLCNTYQYENLTIDFILLKSE